MSNIRPDEIGLSLQAVAEVRAVKQAHEYVKARRVYYPTFSSALAAMDAILGMHLVGVR